VLGVGRTRVVRPAAVGRREGRRPPRTAVVHKVCCRPHARGCRSSSFGQGSLCDVPENGRNDSMIEVTLLGTGSPIPDARRAGPSALVRAGGQTFLVDCGRGVQQRMTAAGAGANALTALLLTHLHSDHIADLGDLLITRWVTTFDPNPVPLPIIGPPGTAEV